MGDVGDDFRAYKEMVKERKLERLKNNTEQLKDIDIPYTRDSNGSIHFQTKKGKVLFYPTTKRNVKRGGLTKAVELAKSLGI
ncbi:hypothetical protein ACSPNK_004280 [Providencia stuartii]|uniref:hypothetical protein n=1 Tax=Providencia stuartii TaxID=588 RepID=UPI00069D2CE2|nr:hypothetical protein [Providencia stuartii]KNZ82477.1 hypothetical protein AFL46_20405 [Providencia stuartii]